MNKKNNGSVVSESNGSHKRVRLSVEELYDRSFVHDILPYEKILALARKKDAGNRKAREQMILCNLRFVKTIAEEYRDFADTRDLCQEGIIGLMKAIGKFDPKRETPLHLYASHAIKQAIWKYLGNDATIRVPVHVATRRRAIMKIADALEIELGRTPTPEDVRKETGLNSLHIQDAFNPSGVVLFPIYDQNDCDGVEVDFREVIHNEHTLTPFEILERKEAITRFKESLSKILKMLDDMSLSDRDKGAFIYTYNLDGSSTGKYITMELVAKKIKLTRQGAQFTICRIRRRLGEIDPQLIPVLKVLEVCRKKGF